MRLTKSDKDAFVRACMHDVPEIDHNEEMRKLLNEWAITTMPEEVLRVLDKYERFFISQCYICTPANLDGAYVMCDPNKSQGWVQQKEPELWAKLVELSEARSAQQQTRYELEKKLRGIINTCGTLKVATERLPEFVKYLPTERDGGGTINLPVANVIAELTNLGWPKDQPLAQGA